MSLENHKIINLHLPHIMSRVKWVSGWVMSTNSPVVLDIRSMKIFVWRLKMGIKSFRIWKRNVGVIILRRWCHFWPSLKFIFRLICSMVYSFDMCFVCVCVRACVCVCLCVCVCVCAYAFWYNTTSTSTAIPCLAKDPLAYHTRDPSLDCPCLYTLFQHAQLCAWKIWISRDLNIIHFL